MQYIYCTLRGIFMPQRMDSMWRWTLTSIMKHLYTLGIQCIKLDAQQGTAVSSQSLAFLDIFSNQAIQNQRFLQFGLLFFNYVKRF